VEPWGKVTGNLRTLRGVSTPTCGNPVTTRLQGFSQTRQAHPEKSQTGDVPSRGREAAEGAATSRGAADLAGLSAGRLSPLEAPRRSRSPPARDQGEASPRFSSPNVFDDLDELVELVAVVAGEFDEFSRALNDGAAFGCASDGDPAPAAELEQSLVAEDS
jgi:hypothetical protein